MSFLSAMERSEHDGSAREEAFALLCEESREALRDRARRASALAGRDVPSWEMIAQGRFRLRLDPRRAEIETTIEGERATVELAAAARHAEVEFRREDGTWRLVL